jgi:hypothetical protein
MWKESFIAKIKDPSLNLLGVTEQTGKTSTKDSFSTLGHVTAQVLSTVVVKWLLLLILIGENKNQNT